MDQNLKGFWETQLVQDVEKLVGRQGANGADRIGCRKECVGASAATSALKLGAIAGQGHHLTLGGWLACLVHQRTMTWEP